MFVASLVTRSRRASETSPVVRMSGLTYEATSTPERSFGSKAGQAAPSGRPSFHCRVAVSLSIVGVSAPSSTGTSWKMRLPTATSARWTSDGTGGVLNQPTTECPG